MTRTMKLRFILIMMVVVCAILATLHDGVLDHLLAPWTEHTAKTTVTLIRWTGLTVVSDGWFIAHPDGFVYEIVYRCTGVFPIFFLAVLICAYPAFSGYHKLVGLLVCLPVVYFVNLIRLAHLFFIGVNHPESFVLIHEVFWEALVAGEIIGLWLGWMRWAESRKKDVDKTQVSVIH